MYPLCWPPLQPSKVATVSQIAAPQDGEEEEGRREGRRKVETAVLSSKQEPNRGLGKIVTQDEVAFYEFTFLYGRTYVFEKQQKTVKFSRG